MTEYTALAQRRAVKSVVLTNSELLFVWISKYMDVKRAV